MLGCELTRAGLGFPQYSNDEVVIPALVRAGYSLEDARNYAVAACWEFIIPGKGLDIVNQGAVSFPYAVNQLLLSDDILHVDETQMEKMIRDNQHEKLQNSGDCLIGLLMHVIIILINIAGSVPVQAPLSFTFG